VATADASNARRANPRPVLLFRFLLFIVQSPTFVLGLLSPPKQRSALE
jgi:hypothetical protein